MWKLVEELNGFQIDRFARERLRQTGKVARVLGHAGLGRAEFRKAAWVARSHGIIDWDRWADELGRTIRASELRFIRRDQHAGRPFGGRAVESARLAPPQLYDDDLD